MSEVPANNDIDDGSLPPLPPGTVIPSSTTNSAFQRIKWEYVVPILLTPIAHICVSLIRKYPQHRKKLINGIVLATFLTVNSRVLMMYDAGYPGRNDPNNKGLPKWLKIFMF